MLIEDPFNTDMSSIAVRDRGDLHPFYIASDDFLDNLLFV